MEVIVREVCKSYSGRQVLDRVSFTAGPGVTCLMAPSGAGKTTLLRILLGLERADSGRVLGLEGRRLSAVFQEDRLLEHLNARENLRFVLGGAYDEDAARTLLEALGLASAGDAPVSTWSGGMKRRLSLARALSAPWDLLALDEPFTGLDGENRARAIACIRQAAVGPVLLVTHDLADAADLSAKIVRL